MSLSVPIILILSATLAAGSKLLAAAPVETSRPATVFLGPEEVLVAAQTSPAGTGESAADSGAASIGEELLARELIKKRIREEIRAFSQEFTMTRDLGVAIGLEFHDNGLRLLRRIPGHEVASIPLPDLMPLADSLRITLLNTHGIPYAAEKNFRIMLVERLGLAHLEAQGHLSISALDPASDAERELPAEDPALAGMDGPLEGVTRPDALGEPGQSLQSAFYEAETMMRKPIPDFTQAPPPLITREGKTGDALAPAAGTIQSTGREAGPVSTVLSSGQATAGVVVFNHLPVRQATAMFSSAAFWQRAAALAVGALADGAPVFLLLSFALALPLGALHWFRDSRERARVLRLRFRLRGVLRGSRKIANRAIGHWDAKQRGAWKRLEASAYFRRVAGEHLESVANGNSAKEHWVILWLGLSGVSSFVQIKAIPKPAAKRIRETLRRIQGMEAAQLDELMVIYRKGLDNLILDGQEAERWIVQMTGRAGKMAGLTKVVPNEGIAVSALFVDPVRSRRLVKRFKRARRAAIISHFHAMRSVQSEKMRAAWCTTQTQLHFLAKTMSDGATTAQGPAVPQRAPSQHGDLMIPSLDL